MSFTLSLPTEYVYNSIFPAPTRAGSKADPCVTEPRRPMQSIRSITNIADLLTDADLTDVIQVAEQAHTVTIFDWDDTLLSTTFLRRHQWGREFAWEDDEELDDAVASAYRLLSRAIAHGDTFIITNGVAGWVEESAAKYAPMLLPLLSRVTIISARSLYELALPGDARAWKINAFLDVCQTLESDFVNLIAVGDSFHEMEAAWAMGSELERSFLKTVKFKERPTANELRRQLETVEKKFDEIVSHPQYLN